MVVSSRDIATANTPPNITHGTVGSTVNRTLDLGRTRRSPSATRTSEERQVPDEGPNSASTTAPKGHGPSKRRSRKKRRAHITVASLNVCGRGNAAQPSALSKWNEIHFLMKEQKIAVLAVQEAHLDDQTVGTLKTLYGRRLHILHSQNPRTTNADGVAIILNKDLLDVSQVVHEIIVPGRATMASIPWRDDTTLIVLNVYAPNAPRESEGFWKKIRHIWKQQKLPTPTVVMGDFNLVEQDRDRSPKRSDDLAAVKALQSLLGDWKLVDGWRDRYPDHNAFTYPALPGLRGQSRLDRIYIAPAEMATSEGWEIHQTHVRTDHKLVSAQIVHGETPFIGKGRWTVNLNLLKDNKTMNSVIERGRILQNSICDLPDVRTDEENIQTLYATYKKDVIKILHDASKKDLPKILQRIQKLESEVHKLNNTPAREGQPLDEEQKMTLGLVQERIAQLEQMRFTTAKNNIAAKVVLENETNSKFWNRMNREKKPRDILYSLEKPVHLQGDDLYERRSDRMAEIAKDYHDRIQDVQEDATVEQREAATSEVLANIDKGPSKKARAQMEATFLPSDVQQALLTSAHGKAAGLDGLPYEFWRAIEERTRLERGTEDERMNPFKILADLFNDIHTHGLTAGSAFAEGWMCPIYKQKGDRRNIANHRPITLLNTDYKLLTKIVATRLALVAQQVIHANQAGFIPGRSIMDQIRLTQMMIDFAEAAEEDGVIVALDQEKAYDRIDHEYLWKVLKRFNLPEKTINLVKSLYSMAYTVVVINGEMSTPFQVRRGVRQGDPMSCILFDLAIEPLALTLRKSNLRGYNIPGVPERLIVTLFADDTTVYLAAEDTYDGLLAILGKWCLASRAKFNEHKTQFIPIGTKTHRDRVIATRKLQPSHPTLPEGPAVARDGDHVRILGAFLGNHTSLDDIWKPVINKTLKAVKRWKKSHPSLTGKAIIAQMTIGGITQYLTTAHGMPPHIETALVTTLRNFIWDDRRPKVAMDVLCAAKEDGGIGLLDLRSRNEAIDVMLLKSYLNLSDDRPTWAFVADTILQRYATKASGMVHPDAAVNPMLQSWTVNPNARNLPPMLGRIIKAARREQLAVNVAKPNRTLRRRMPAWFHVGTNPGTKKLQNKPAAKCLRQGHGVQTVADLLRESMRVRRPAKTPEHTQTSRCGCNDCVKDRLEKHCKNPARCQSMAAELLEQLHPKWRLTTYFTTDDLSLTPRRKEKNAANLKGEGDGMVTFDPSLSCKDINLIFRIHTTPSFDMPALRIPTPFGLEDEARSVTIAVWAQETAQTTTPKRAIAAYAGPDDPGNFALRLPERIESREQAYLAAIMECASRTPPFAPLTLAVQDSSIVETLCVSLKTIEKQGWAACKQPSILQTAVSILRRRSAATTFRLPAGEGTNMDYLTALLMARAVMDHRDEWEMPGGHPEYVLQGAQLSEMTQALAYNLIRKKRRPPVLAKSTRLRIQQVRAGLGDKPDDETIWAATRDKALTKKISSFLWKLLHNAMSVGKYWDNIPGRENLRDCPACQVEESMEHILCVCDAPGRAKAWRLAEECLGRKNVRMKPLHITTLMACGLATPLPEGQTGPGSTRLLRIILSETAHLIWKMRCERRIRWEDDASRTFSDQEIENRWRHAINTRLTHDKLMTNPRFGRKALKTNLVLSTWSGTLANEHLLPEHWISHPRVLVGSGPPLRRAGRRVRGDPAG